MNMHCFRVADVVPVSLVSTLYAAAELSEEMIDLMISMGQMCWVKYVSSNQYAQRSQCAGCILENEGDRKC